MRLDGRDVTAAPPNKRDVNMVFQSYALFPHMSVFENVAFGLRRKSVPKDQITRQVGEMLEIVNLTGREQRRPRELSGGQQQRVALARALVNHPKALLLDEPLGALDLKLRQAMQVELKRIQREVGITFVYVTHDQNEALTMSDRIAVMNDGMIEHLGPPREIYEHPATRFVAGFIGTSNLLTGSLARVTGGRGVIEVSPDERIIVPEGRSALAAGQQVELTVRPEKIELAAGRRRPEAARCAAPSPRWSTWAPPPVSRCAPRPGRTSSSSSRTQPRPTPRLAGATTCGWPGIPSTLTRLADRPRPAVHPARPRQRGVGQEVPMDPQHGSDPGPDPRRPAPTRPSGGA